MTNAVVRTPLHLKILLHHHVTGHRPLPRDEGGPAVCDFTTELHDAGLIEPSHLPFCFTTTERGRTFIKHILNLPLPVQTWKMPP